MKKAIILIGILCALLSACTSQDEPEVEYTGPWEIDYAEYYVGWHTNNPSFKTWFQQHTNNFESAEFSNYSQTQKVQYNKEAGDWIEWDDYSKWFAGIIEWSEVIDNATEGEIKDLIDTFQSFSSNDGKANGKYDDFHARYRKKPIK